MILCAIILFAFCVWGFSYVAFMEKGELVSFYSILPTDRILGAVLWMATLVGLTWFAQKMAIQKIVKWIGIGIVFLQSTVIFWATKATPEADSLMCFLTAQDAANNTWQNFQIGEYLYKFPYQASLVAIEEVQFRIVHQPDTVYLLFRFINMAALMLIVCAICGITQHLFGETAAMVTSVLFAGSLPISFYVIFLYGNMLSNALAYAAVWSIIVYFNNGRMRNMVASIALVSCAMAVKPTALIVMLAICIVWALVAVKRQQWKMLLGILALVLLSGVIGKAVQYSYSQRSQVPMNPGVSNLVYIAMGLDIQSETSWFAPGWYTGWSFVAYSNANYDYDEMTRQQIEMLKDNAKYFVEHPQETKEFFVKKIVSQWLDPVFGIWVYIAQHTEPTQFGTLTETMHEKPYNEGINQVLGCLQASVYLAALYGAVCIIKKQNVLQIFPAVIFLGGFFYLLISEGKSQYAISFYPMLFPICAYGILMLKTRVCTVWHHKKGNDINNEGLACN